MPEQEAKINELERARQGAEERKLVTAAVGGSASAFEALYRRHAGQVYGLCLRMTGHHHTAEVCVQEGFVQAWRNLPRFETRSAFGTWLHRIAVNCVLQHLRRRSEQLGTVDSVEREVADELEDRTATDPGRARDIEAAIATLPPGARHALVLAGIYGYSHEESASMLGIAVGTCKAQLHRARTLLAARMMEPEART